MEGRAGEADGPDGVVGVDDQRGRYEALAVDELGVARGPDCLDQAARAADVGLGGIEVWRDSAEVLGAEVTAEAVGRRTARVCEGDGHVRRLRGDLLELARVGDAIRGPGIVQEHDPPPMALVEQRPQHRHNRRDPAAAADQRELLGAITAQNEVAGCGLEAEDHPRGCVIVQEARYKSLGMGPRGQLEQPVGAVRRGRGRVAPSTLHAVDLDRAANELTGIEAAPDVVRAEGERDAVGSRMTHGRYLCAQLVQRPAGPDQLEIAVHAVWRGQGLDQPGAEDTMAEVAAPRLGGWPTAHATAGVGCCSFSVHLYSKVMIPISFVKQNSA